MGRNLVLPGQTEIQRKSYVWRVAGDRSLQLQAVGKKNERSFL